MKAKVKLGWCRDYPAACIELNKLIADRYPGDPDALDCLTIKTLPCEVKGSGINGKVVAAWPTLEGATTDNVLMVYFGGELPPSASE